ncbi:MAG: nuclear transport factor 2 family protein [Alphaproteobacteria bacterium]|nr:nuclear transport factor 2 family protein [Alphaproteobacteria bacterium]
MKKHLPILAVLGMIVGTLEGPVMATEKDREENKSMLGKSVSDRKELILPEIINSYIEASNRHDIKSILACFTENAVVHDEKKEFKGKQVIKEWLTSTIEKYNFQFIPLTLQDTTPEILVSIKVSGTFDGSPVILNYHFMIENEKLSSLKIG